MKKPVLFLIILFQASCLLAQLSVTNVEFSQRTDGSLIVDIYYDLSDDDSETKTVSVEASDDNGSTWDLTCASLTGDVGEGIAQGTEKHIVWDFYTDNPNQSGSQYKVRVTATEPTTGTMTGNDGTTYATVKIGDQWWMAENLKETKYRNGDDIPKVEDNSTWAGLSTGARCAYNNSESTANTYGYLYNWYAVDDDRNIAPSGWRVPTDAEWTTLTTYLGGESVAGGKLKETGTTHWNSPNTGATDESGFSALPGGYRYFSSGVFYHLGYLAQFWSATESSTDHAWNRYLDYHNSDVRRYNDTKRYGFSVRLVRD